MCKKGDEVGNLTLTESESKLVVRKTNESCTGGVQNIVQHQSYYDYLKTRATDELIIEIIWRLNDEYGEVSPIMIYDELGIHRRSRMYAEREKILSHTRLGRIMKKLGFVNIARQGHRPRYVLEGDRK